MIDSHATMAVRANADAWLRELQEGDQVIVSGRHQTVRKVARLTATQIVVDHCRFRRDDGREIGGGTWGGILREATPDAVARIRETAERKRTVNLLRDTDWSKLPSDVLARVAAVLEDQ